jgi:hypothetical protein
VEVGRHGEHAAVVIGTLAFAIPVVSGRRHAAQNDDFIHPRQKRVVSYVKDGVQAHLRELYGVEVGHDLISRVTDAVGVNLEGERDVLGLWFQSSEGAKFWLAVLNELKQRGIRDALICCVDGLTGFPRGDRGRLPQHLGADLHRPPDPPTAAIPTEEAARKLIYLAITNAQKSWR